MSLLCWIYFCIIEVAFRQVEKGLIFFFVTFKRFFNYLVSHSEMCGTIQKKNLKYLPAAVTCIYVEHANRFGNELRIHNNVFSI